MPITKNRFQKLAGLLNEQAKKTKTVLKEQAGGGGDVYALSSWERGGGGDRINGIFTDKEQLKQILLGAFKNLLESEKNNESAGETFPFKYGVVVFVTSMNTNQIHSGIRLEDILGEPVLKVDVNETMKDPKEQKQVIRKLKSW